MRTPLHAWLGQPLRVLTPSSSDALAPGATATVSLRGLGRPAAVVSVVIPVLLMVVGIVVAVLSAVLSERPGGEGLGTLGVEVGAVLWFAGAVVFGAQRSTTVGRGLLLVLAALAGYILIVVALAFDWTGAPLALAMEFGVGATAVLVVDVVLLGRLQPRLEQLARDADTSVVTVRVAPTWPVLMVHVDHVDVDDPTQEAP